MNGCVVRLNRTRGFGFIRISTGHEYFFHLSGLVAGTHHFHDLTEGQGDTLGTPVSFDLEDSPKGPRCVNIQVLTPPAA